MLQYFIKSRHLYPENTNSTQICFNVGRYLRSQLNIKTIFCQSLVFAGYSPCSHLEQNINESSALVGWSWKVIDSYSDLIHNKVHHYHHPSACQTDSAISFLYKYIVPLDMKGCICHFIKWQIHPFISKGTTCHGLHRELSTPYFRYRLMRWQISWIMWPRLWTLISLAWWTRYFLIPQAGYLWGFFHWQAITSLKICTYVICPLDHWPIPFKFSVTWSRVSLPRSTTSSDWKFVLFVKFKSQHI